MRRKQVQRKPRCSERLKEKCGAALDCLEAKRSNKGSLKTAGPRCLVKRQKVEIAETETEKGPNDRRTVDCREANDSSKSRISMNCDEEQRVGEAAVGGLCAESICRNPEDLGERGETENGAQRTLELEHSGLNGSLEEAEESETNMQMEMDNSVFFDEDSNQVMPVGQFFGNIELVQDYPPRAHAAVAMSRRQYRRLHYIAKEDSDDDVYEDSYLETLQHNDNFSSSKQSGSCIRNGSRGPAAQKES
ncbi:UPF0688 protein C1orf174 homolog isoform X2 [Megalops cyprinoides]|uniref:UPF0688 protein C1orf174 homolog isoform X2 n=2 Tax=Megalops cyprinoides TaxID=118141 RepID=UPI001865098E|nr:UPF0688 protein C1orf174 homolog isoform X2 [Megalops cyprinoides]